MKLRLVSHDTRLSFLLLPGSFRIAGPQIRRHTVPTLAVFNEAAYLKRGHKIKEVKYLTSLHKTKFSIS